jgi:sporulation protein YlmC with PRC-barrel domain
MTDEIAWTAIEASTSVFSSEGEQIGHVSKVVGDAEADVFTGLAVSIGALSADRFVASERVRAIYVDRIDVDLTKAEIERLPDHEDAPVVQWRPGGGVRGFFERLFGRR